MCSLILSFPIVVQWMGSAGVSRSEIKAVAQVIVDAMLSLEEQALGLAEPPEVNGGTPGVPSTAKSGILHLAHNQLIQNLLKIDVCI